MTVILSIIPKFYKVPCMSHELLKVSFNPPGRTNPVCDVPFVVSTRKLPTVWKVCA